MSRELALRDISLRFEVRSLSGHSGHARACGWPDLVAKDPEPTFSLAVLLPTFDERMLF